MSDRSNSPPPAEQTHWSWGLIGFYVSCALVGLGATIGSGGYLVFESTAALAIGAVMCVAFSFTSLKALRAARHE